MSGLEIMLERKKRGLTQKELSEASGYSQQMVYLVEHDRGTHKARTAILKALGLVVEDPVPSVNGHINGAPDLLSDRPEPPICPLGSIAGNCTEGGVPASEVEFTIPGPLVLFARVNRLKFHEVLELCRFHHVLLQSGSPFDDDDWPALYTAIKPWLSE